MKTLSVLRSLDRNTKAKLYLVGGAVRDFLLGVRPNDYDVILTNYSLEGAKKYLEGYGKVTEVSLSGSDIKLLLFVAKDDTVVAQITYPKRYEEKAPYKFESNQYIPINDDLGFGRDFSINALCVPIGTTVISHNVIDVNDGLSDLKNEVIRMHGYKRGKIIASPIRILRLVTLFSKTKFKIDEETKNVIKSHVALLKKVPAEAIRDELFKILMSSVPSESLYLMQELGIMKVILPELDTCFGVEQQPQYHKYDVFGHCVHACDHTPPDVTLRVAALLHDVGKPEVREWSTVKNRYTFYNHEKIGTDLAKALLERLKAPNELIDKVCFLVSSHMYHFTEDMTDGALRKLICEWGLTVENVPNLDKYPLFLIRRADRLGNGIKVVGTAKIQLDMQERIKAILLKDGAFSIKNLSINGTDIMESFQIGQCPLVGKLLKYLLDIVLEDPSRNDKVTLLSDARRYLESLE